MDAYHYDKIADKLIQFHSKLPLYIELNTELAKNQVRKIRLLIMELLNEVDTMAKLDNTGHVR